MMNYEEPRDVQAGTPQLVGTVEDSNGDNNSMNIAHPTLHSQPHGNKIGFGHPTEPRPLIQTNKE